MSEPLHHSTMQNQITLLTMIVGFDANDFYVIACKPEGITFQGKFTEDKRVKYTRLGFCFEEKLQEDGNIYFYAEVKDLCVITTLYMTLVKNPE